MDPPPLPEGVRIQSTYVDSEGRASGWRVWGDGRHEGRRAGEDWVAGPRIDARGMAEVDAVLAQAGLEEMAGVHRPDAEREHPSALWFQVAPAGRPPVTVGLLDGARLEAIDRLVARLAPVLSGGAAP